MNAAVLALAACIGFPATSMFAHALPHTTVVGWSDTPLLLDLRFPRLRARLSEDQPEPQASALDEGARDPVEDADPVLRIVLLGCKLTLPALSFPKSWQPDMGPGAPAPLVLWNSHWEKDGHWIAYQHIPRRAGRPKSYLAYRFPLASTQVTSGYDLDKPNTIQRRGWMRDVGHGGVDLLAKMGAPIATPRLEHQVGDAEVLYVGPMYGKTVVTRHVVREAGSDHDYLLIFGHLKRAADDAQRGRRLPEEAILGFVGNTASPRFVHLHLEVRRVRDGVDPRSLSGDALHSRKYSVVTDPRNVLPLRAHLPIAQWPRAAAHRYWLGQGMVLTLE